jgi:hypothetical protein
MRQIPIIPVCHGGLEPGDLPMPLSLRHGISLTEPDGLSRLYLQIARVIGCQPPEIDFPVLAGELSNVSTGLRNEAPQDDDTASLVAGRAARARLLEALKHTHWKWRTLDQLAAVAAVSADEAADLLRAEADVRFSRAKSGEVIAGLRSRVGDEH